MRNGMQKCFWGKSNLLSPHIDIDMDMDIDVDMDVDVEVEGFWICSE